MASTTVTSARDAAHVGALLDSPEIAGLIADLQLTRWTGRPGYPLRSMVGLALVKGVYALPTWTRAVRLVKDHAALRKPSALPQRRCRLPVHQETARAQRHAHVPHRAGARRAPRHQPGDGEGNRH